MMTGKGLLNLLRYFLLVVGSLCICAYDLNWLGELNGLGLLWGIILIAYSVNLSVVMCDE